LASERPHRSPLRLPKLWFSSERFDEQPPLPGLEPLWIAVRTRVWLHVALLLATVLSTTYWGSVHYAAFQLDFASNGIIEPSFFQGFWYSLTILGILGAHELGHYFACRYYRVDASLPYFLPAPVLTGTLGAFIRIRQPIPTKRMLFDIGVAGPIAGFVVALPALFVGLFLSRVVPLPEDFVGLSLGEPLLFKSVAWLIWGEAPEGYSLNLHPVGFAAWFGLLATALNLFPIGQLDGGHISYATLGARSTSVTVGAAAAVILLAFFSPSWIAWAVLMVAMLITFGPRHPRTLDDHIPLDRTRRVIAIFALVMLMLCFTPAPIEFTELLGQQ
jgi:membrane-associated protease RseP (regulator of RpoE activity)